MLYASALAREVSTFPNSLFKTLAALAIVIFADAPPWNCVQAQQVIPLIAFTNSWRFDQTGTDLRTEWTAHAYDDASWPVGAGVFYHAYVPSLEPGLTALSPTNAAGAFTTTFYFRTRFVFTNDPNRYIFVASNLVDDGAVFHLNGQEVQRINLPFFSINYNTRAQVQRDAVAYVVLEISPTNVLQGENLLAVEIHQANFSPPPDVVFGSSFTALPTGMVSIVQQPLDQTTLESWSVFFPAQATGAAPIFYQWFKDGQAVAGATNAELQIRDAHLADAGSYSLVASNSYSTAVSSNAALVVRPSTNKAPGQLDASFNVGRGASISFVRGLAVQDDGKVLVGGAFTAFNGVARNYLARLFPDGSLDSSFAPQIEASGGSTQPAVYSAVVQPDGKIFVLGRFNSVNGESRRGIARLHSDGSVDESFNPGLGANGVVRNVITQPDGKLLVAGDFTVFDGVGFPRITRLRPNGDIDVPGFNRLNGVNDIIRSFALLEDGKILIGGEFTLVANQPRKYLARLNNNGTHDNSFPNGSGPNDHVYAVALLPDGRILIAGNFTSVNGTNINRVARLHPDGSLDSTFSPTATTTAAIYSLVTQADGKIVLGGRSGTNGSIFRLNPGGSTDATFDPGTGPGGNVFSVILQEDGGILAGGDFATCDDVSVNAVTRLHGDPAPPRLRTTLSRDGLMTIYWPNWADGYRLQTIESFAPTGWVDSPLLPGIQGNWWVVTNVVSGSNQLFRLNNP